MNHLRRWIEVAVLTVAMIFVTLSPRLMFAQAELTRKVRSKVAPTYPDLARRMNITGVVKVLVTVAPDGTLKESKVVGGNPLLVNAAVDALKKWKFEPAKDDSTGTVEFKFQAQ